MSTEGRRKALETTLAGLNKRFGDGVVMKLGEAAKMSPNCALLFLKAVLLTLATLLATVDISVCEALRPESDVKNDMD